MSVPDLSMNECSWKNLPYVSLVSIFQFLNYKDRFHASLVCRDWSVIFDCPTLWKEMDLLFRGDMVEDSRKALKFAQKYV